MDILNDKKTQALLQFIAKRYVKTEDGEELTKALQELEEKVNNLDISGVDIETDETLSYLNGVLSVNTADEASENNSLPITSAAVYTQIGNIETLLKTI